MLFGDKDQIAIEIRELRTENTRLRAELERRRADGAYWEDRYQRQCAENEMLKRRIARLETNAAAPNREE